MRSCSIKNGDENQRKSILLTSSKVRRRSENFGDKRELEDGEALVRWGKNRLPLSAGGRKRHEKSKKSLLSCPRFARARQNIL
jgi:hypothetical protein